MDAEIKDGKLKWTLVISLLVRHVRSLCSSSTYVWPLQLWMPGHQKCSSSRDMTKVPVNFFFFFWSCCLDCRVWVHHQGLNMGPWQWKCQVLTSGPPGNSCHWTSSYAEKWNYWSFSYVWLFTTPWTAARQAPLSTVHGLLQAKILE